MVCSFHGGILRRRYHACLADSTCNSHLCRAWTGVVSSTRLFWCRRHTADRGSGDGACPIARVEPGLNLCEAKPDMQLWPMWLDEAGELSFADAERARATIEHVAGGLTLWRSCQGDRWTLRDWGDYR